MTGRRLVRLVMLGAGLIALVACLPLRIALGLVGLDRYGLAARSVEGTVWDGRIAGLMVGGVPVGQVRAALAPARLLVGQARVRLWSEDGEARALAGALVSGWGGTGVEDVNGLLPLGQRLAPLPIGALAMQSVSIRFKRRACVAATGHVRADLAMPLPGLDFARGLAGDIRCDGDDVLVPLVTQSGRARMNLRIMPTGRYRLDLAVTAPDPQLDQALGRLGFRRAGEVSGLRIDGSL